MTTSAATEGDPVIDDTNPRERVRLAALDAAEKLRALAEVRERVIAAVDAKYDRAETLTIGAMNGTPKALAEQQHAVCEALRALDQALSDAPRGTSASAMHPTAAALAITYGIDGASDDIRWARGLEVYAKSLRPRGRPPLPPGTPKAEDEPVRSFCVTPTQRTWLRAQPGGTTAALRKIIDALGPASFPAAKWYESAEEAADVTTGARLDGHETRLHDLARQAGVGPWELLRAAIERERAGKPARGGASKKKNGRA
jgi:hypothetical protein